MWLAPALRFTWRAALFWLLLGRDLASRRGAHTTFVLNPRKPGLVALYEKLQPRTIYEGPFVNSSLTEARVYEVEAAQFGRIWRLYARDLAATHALTPARGGRYVTGRRVEGARRGAWRASLAET